jgi:hypothetical protein
VQRCVVGFGPTARVRKHCAWAPPLHRRRGSRATSRATRSRRQRIRVERPRRLSMLRLGKTQPLDRNLLK